MMKLKEKIVVISFIVMIFGLAAVHLLMGDNINSKSERRKLAKLPELTMESLEEETYFSDLETYLQDQFPGREQFRHLKSMTKFGPLRQLDNNQIYFVDEGIYKWENKNKPKEINYFVKKINSLTEKFFDKNLDRGRVFYSVIPDKNYFVAEKNGYPHLDYEKMISTVETGLNKLNYIDIFKTLTIDDYYLTDAHWNQPALEKTVSAIGDAMEISDKLSLWDSYEAKTLSPFYGVYSGQAAMGDRFDRLTYLENDVTKNAKVKSVEVKGELPIYKVGNFNNLDGYDVFLNGAQALLEIDNPAGEKGKELVVFRDSFGSSITPLLLAPYSKVWVVDLRYLTSDFLPNLVKINENQDVLFLYSTSLINSGMLLK